MLDLARYKAFIFDLDNTIYSENDYLFPAYKAIAEHTASSDSVVAKEAEKFLKDYFLENGRSQLFDSFIEHFKIRNATMNDILNILRTNKTEHKIKMNQNISSLLKKLILKEKHLFVLTNGNVVQQKNKVSLIDWEGMYTHFKFVFANESEKKPSPLTVLNILKENNYSQKNVLMIGDGVEDEACARDSDISFLHINSLLTQLTEGIII